MRHQQQLRQRPIRTTVWFAVSAVPWIVGATVDGDARLALWSLALVIDFLGLWLAYPVPGLGVRQSGDRLHHHPVAVADLRVQGRGAVARLHQGRTLSGPLPEVRALHTSAHGRRGGRHRRRIQPGDAHPAAPYPAVLVLAGVALADVRRSRGRPPEVPSPPW
ncbi:low temperature requirement protein A [Micromonospora maris]|nr:MULTISPECIES: low temperature requirement protein A [Micromonospora]WSK41242.1 low temperature requirement protein A [Micromonospora maris]